MELYVTAVSNRLSYGTIKSYLSALKFIHIMAGFSLDNLFQDRLRLLVRGVRRSHGNSKSRPKRLPITIADLRSLSRWVRSNLPAYDALLFEAAFNMAFFGLLRVSEFTCPTIRDFQRNVHLGMGDVQVNHATEVLTVRIKVSKSDPFRQGASIRITRTLSDVCPFSAMVAYMGYRRQVGPGPLFLLSNGQALTREHIVIVLSRVFPHVPAGLMGSHSFRIGGASRLCILGVPDATIQILGRWSSSAFKKYLRLSDEYVSHLQASMSRDDA